MANTRKSKDIVSIIGAVKSPLGFFTLVVLITEGVFLALFVSGKIPVQNRLQFGCLMVALFFFLVGLVALLGWFRPELVGLPQTAKRPPQTAKKPEEGREANTIKIIGEEEPAPPVDAWSREIRPVLHQAIEYTVPTYYLNVDLMMVDWNIAFDLIFSRLGGTLRGKHVKSFILELVNCQAVLEHAQKFTRDVYDNRIPFVDVEPLIYYSDKYGAVNFTKVAAQLHDSEGRQRGWSVSLMIREINWEIFEADLLEATRKGKLWSVYSASYDRVLLQYPPYRRLIHDVISVLPSSYQNVADVGAGTGNVTEALLDARQSVTAVENNPGMLDRLRSKNLSIGKPLTVVKASAENLRTLTDASFDGVVMVNLLFAVNDPYVCLQEASRILRPKGVLGLSTTHADSDLNPLLNGIKIHLIDLGKYDDLCKDYQMVRDVNQQIARDIAKRHTPDQYREWIRAAGFEITKDVPSTYDGAVMLIHAKKK